MRSITTLAIGALKVLQTWNAKGRPSIVTPGVVRNANGSVTAPSKNGTLITTSTTGRVSTAQMPAGKPFLFADGSIVTNNGDGSYTTITADGRSTTTRYPQGLASFFGGTDSGNTLLYAGLGLVALLLVTR